MVSLLATIIPHLTLGSNQLWIMMEIYPIIGIILYHKQLVSQPVKESSPIANFRRYTTKAWHSCNPS